MITIQDTIYMGTAAAGGGGSGDAVWGSITGTLSNQTDLSNALATKQDVIDANNKLSASYVSGLATVATTGAYSDLSGTPTVDLSYDGTSTNAQSGIAVKSAIDATISSVYKAAGSVAFASLPTPSSANEGYVYNVTDAFTTDSQFVEGSGKSYPAGTNVVVIDTGSSVYKFDVLTGMVDLSGYVPTSRTINGKALTSNITLTASDVSALPDSTIIPTVNNATLTITQGGVSKGTFTANASSDVTISLDASSSISYDNSTINENSSNELQAIGVKEVRTDTAIRLWEGTEQQWNQGEITDWYCWHSAGASNWSAGGTLQKNDYNSIAYGNGRFVAIADGYIDGGAIPSYSTNGGTSWTQVTVPGAYSGQGIAYGNGRFVLMQAGVSYYSDDGGETWSTGGTHSSGSWKLFVYDDVNDRFVAVNLLSKETIYSSDGGETWNNGASLPTNTSCKEIAYGNGRIVVIDSSSNKTYYSSDGGDTWTAGGTLTYKSESIAYGDGRFVVVGGNGYKSHYSDDGGETWTLGGDTINNGLLVKIAYGNGIFIALKYGDSVFVSSDDGGETWSSGTLPFSGEWTGFAYGNDKFIAVTNNSNKTLILTVTNAANCYTTTAVPTTLSTVYSEPGIVSDKIITNVGTGNITLSDSVTYEYTPSGNTKTYESIGISHPDYLCFIDNKEVKKGSTTIANINEPQVNADWDASSGVSQILNKPTIPTVNNATLTITQGGTTKGTFTANASSDVTIALDAGGGSSLPSQTGQSGKYLTTDGTDASWATVYAMVITDYTA